MMKRLFTLCGLGAVIAGAAWAGLVAPNAPSGTAVVLPEVSKDEWQMFSNLLNEAGQPLAKMDARQQAYVDLMLRLQLAEFEAKPEAEQVVPVIEAVTALIACGEPYAGFDVHTLNGIVGAGSTTLATKARVDNLAAASRAVPRSHNLPELDAKGCEVRLNEVLQLVNSRVAPTRRD